MITEFVEESNANLYARKYAELTCKPAYYWFDKQSEKFKVEHDDEKND